MNVRYLQRKGTTIVMMGLKDKTWVGMARTRPGDKFRRSLGIAVAMLKAFPGPVAASGQEFKALSAVWSTQGWETVGLTDVAVLAWAKLWHEYRIALRSIEERRESTFKGVFAHIRDSAANFAGFDGSPDQPVGDSMEERRAKNRPVPAGGALEAFKKIPSDGQLAENFGLRLLKEIGEPPFVKVMEVEVDARK